MGTRDHIQLTTVSVEQVDATINHHKLTDQVTGLHKNCFGTVVEFKVPDGCNAVVLCTRSFGSLKPLRILLTHQIYKEDIEKLLEDRTIREVVAIPIISKEYITISTN